MTIIEWKAALIWGRLSIAVAFITEGDTTNAQAKKTIIIIYVYNGKLICYTVCIRM